MNFIRGLTEAHLLGFVLPSRSQHEECLHQHTSPGTLRMFSGRRGYGPTGPDRLCIPICKSPNKPMYASNRNRKRYTISSGSNEFLRAYATALCPSGYPVSLLAMYIGLHIVRVQAEEEVRHTYMYTCLSPNLWPANISQGVIARFTPLSWL